MVLHEGVPHLVSTAARLFGRQPDVILGNPRTLLFLLQKILHNKKPGIQPGLEKKWWFFLNSRVQKWLRKKFRKPGYSKQLQQA
jgi:hypothetical protein